MQEKLIIWLDDDAASTARWLVLDAHGNRAGFPQQGPLADAAGLAAQRRVIVMLRGERILAANAIVPGGNPKRILQAAPYALEDRLAGDVEELHVALLHRGAEQRCDFLVVDRDRFATALDALDSAGLNIDAAWPDYLGVPPVEGAEHWWLMQDRLLSRAQWSGYAMPAADAAFLYTHRDADAPLRLTVIGDAAAPAGLAELEGERLADDDRAFTELAATVAALPGPGLLQGEFRRQRDGETNLRRWRWPAIAAAVLLALFLADTGVDAWRLKQEHDLLAQATRDLFQQALPGNQRMVDPRFQIEQALGSANTASNGVLDDIADVANALQTLPKARLNGFNFRNNHFEFSVTVPDATTLETLRTALAERAGQPVSVQSANSTRDGLEGRLLIAEGQSE